MIRIVSISVWIAGGMGRIKNQPTTEIVHGSDKVVNRFVQFLQNAQHSIDVCVDNSRPSLAIESKKIRGAFFDAKRSGVRIRYITEITKDNLGYCKELMSIVDELRHLDGVKGNFYVTEQEYVAPSTFRENGHKFSEWMIYSNVREIIEHEQYVFDSFWNTSSSAERKTREIRNDVRLGITEIIDNPFRTQELFINLVKSAKSEILLVLPTINAFMREHRIGVMRLFKELSTTSEGAINIRILTPTNNTIDAIIEEMKMSTSTYLKIRHLESQAEFTVTTVTILVVDRKASLVIEKVDDSKESFIEAVGLSTYSTSQPTVISYLSIFENFWNQLELYEQLKAHDKIQNEFINIASHEIKTPTQAILGYSNLIQRHPEKQEEMLQAISRNATRLQRLTNDILDVTRIESQSLRLNLERFNLSDVISDVVQDYRSEIEKSNSGIQLLYNRYFDNQNNFTFIEGDRGRIIQVISNLVSNAIKFTNKGGSILITEEERIVDNRNQIVVSIKDSGRGIDAELMPKLFSKFVAKSEKGTGLGLFISKNIVEAHGGKIWVQNNDSGLNTVGATFTFSLPLVRPGNAKSETATRDASKF